MHNILHHYPRIYKRLCAAVLLFCTPFAMAEDYSRAQVELLAAACANCHGTEGRLSTSIPSIAGRPSNVLTLQLLNFKNNSASHVTVMDRIAKGYSDAELKAIADYFSTITP